jgi:hypothetical protein
MLHGRGNQYKFTKSYQDLRLKKLLNINKLSLEEQELVDVSFPDGGGRTDPDLYIIETVPIPADRRSQKIDIRDIISGHD